MIHDMTSAVYKGAYKIEVMFDDGKKGVIDFEKYLAYGGVFERFKDMDFFRNFAINPELGVITWGGGTIDVAPETVYAEATGTPLPSWTSKRRKPAANKTLQPIP